MNTTAALRAFSEGVRSIESGNRDQLAVILTLLSPVCPPSAPLPLPSVIKDFFDALLLLQNSN